jgi:hypothetical protein
MTASAQQAKPRFEARQARMHSDYGRRGWARMHDHSHSPRGGAASLPAPRRLWCEVAPLTNLLASLAARVSRRSAKLVVGSVLVV